VYREIGGHAYGSAYSGPVGAVLTPALHGIEAWAELPYASSLCGACRDVCPVGIDIPRMLLALRRQAVQRRATPFWLRLSLRLYRLAATRPRVFRVAMAGASALTRTLAPGGFFRHLPPPLSGWTAHGDFPAFAARPFSALFAERESKPR
jgi:L-lactate dehydrogenase complex protein LldF